MADLEVRQLRYFRAVADELNFSRAAERLGMAQPPLSRAIGQLERRLGVRLFDRGRGGVTLTAAGTTLLAESRRVLDAVVAAEHRTRRAGAGTPTLVVTAKPGVASALLRRLVDGYRALPASARVEILVSGYGEQAELLRTGRVDLALVGSPYECPGLEAEPLLSEPRVAALPAGHELAAHPTLSRRDLAGLPMPRWPGSSPDQRDYWTGGNDTGAGPPGGPSVRDSSQLIEVVALGMAVALVPLSLAERNQRADVTYRPVPDAGPYTVAIAWPAGARNPWAARFVSTAAELVTAEHDSIRRTLPHTA